MSLIPLLFQLGAGVCSLTVRGFDPFGQPVAPSLFQLHRADGKEHFEATAGRVTAPCGVYRYSAQVGSNRIKGVVVLTRGHRLITLGGSLDSFVYGHTGAPPSIRGRVKVAGLAHHEDLWLRVMSIHDPDFVRDLAIVNGEFSGDVCPIGYCLVLVFRGGIPKLALLVQIPHAKAVRMSVSGTMKDPTIELDALDSQ